MNPPDCYNLQINGKPADLFDILHAAGYPDEPLIHAMKKILFAGKRGKKSKRQDVEEARQSLDRWLAMNPFKPADYKDANSHEVHLQLAMDQMMKQKCGAVTGIAGQWKCTLPAGHTDWHRDQSHPSHPMWPQDAINELLPEWQCQSVFHEDNGQILHCTKPKGNTGAHRCQLAEGKFVGWPNARGDT